LNQAWDLYYQTFRKCCKALTAMTQFQLKDVSPLLYNCRDLELCIPGTYRPYQPVIYITGVHSTMGVITSKQRPRKMQFKGSDGKSHSFLLKGNEDIRQDERVVQLFGMVNTLLSADTKCNKQNLGIIQLSVVPLSMNSGLIGWVPNCDTLHGLIKSYREKTHVLINLEHKLMQKMSPDYDHLPLMNKVEIFEYVQKNTDGGDLANLMWLKAPTAEIWLERRTSYTRTLAVMSMVGYILGLGDRHPSNIMLERYTGKVLHIDFGDCFEVAMVREKFPEKIPFRLTRMLVQAMEVVGVGGNFRNVCINTMNVLRSNRPSIMAVLEAFVYDPLLSWRIVNHHNGPSPPRGNQLQNQPNHVHMWPGGEISQNREELKNQRAVSILKRVENKLCGLDYPENAGLVEGQVDTLINEATRADNLCQSYVGWCSFW